MGLDDSQHSRPRHLEAYRGLTTGEMRGENNSWVSSLPFSFPPPQDALTSTLTRARTRTGCSIPTLLTSPRHTRPFHTPSLHRLFSLPAESFSSALGKIYLSFQPSPDASPRGGPAPLPPASYPRPPTPTAVGSSVVVPRHQAEPLGPVCLAPPEAAPGLTVTAAQQTLEG